MCHKNKFLHNNNRTPPKFKKKVKTISFSKSIIVTKSTRKIGDVLKQDDSKNNIKKK